MNRLLIVLVCVFIAMISGSCMATDTVTFVFQRSGKPSETFVVEMPDGTLDGAVDAFSAIYERPEQISGPDGKLIPNPVTPSRFMAQKIREFCIEVFKAHAVKKAASAAAQAAMLQATTLEKSIKVKDQQQASP